MGERAEAADIDGVIAWTIRAGLESLEQDALISGFCERLVAAGVPLARMQLGTGVVHPSIRGFSATWWDDQGLVAEQSFSHSDRADPAWHRSPLVYMLQSGTEVLTVSLEDGNRPAQWFALFDDLKQVELTEYHAELFPFGWTSTADHETHIGELGVITSWSTRQPGGFGKALPDLRRAVAVFALALKTRVFTDSARALMQTYVGQDAGERIIHGDVHRGDTQVIRAAILLADLRGFTSLSDRHDSAEIVGLLNRYMAVLCGAVEQHGGQVLKFLGDGLLAVFDSRDGAERATQALAAAVQALKGTDSLNATLRAEGAPWMPLDIALHLGDVSYGNVGAEGRLDFTIIGPAVNEAARMEAACSDLERHLLISAAFAVELGDPDRLEDLGEHRLRGIAAPRTLFGLRVHD
ncbi:MAG: adenylate/guanylate cyclase domain-containing protein [Minwuia sp.]|uniref:adenylate/guanylate cyclase domain-containing protein n=1 Tax=Minwuia sp. TaxID=2493630 RepID=UPI003A8A2D93